MEKTVEPTTGAAGARPTLSPDVIRALVAQRTTEAIEAIRSHDRARIWERTNALLSALKDLEKMEHPDTTLPSRRVSYVTREELEEARTRVRMAQARLDAAELLVKRRSAAFDQTERLYPHRRDEALAKLKTARLNRDLLAERLKRAEARLARLMKKPVLGE